MTLMNIDAIDKFLKGPPVGFQWRARRRIHTFEMYYIASGGLIKFCPQNLFPPATSPPPAYMKRYSNTRRQM